MRAGTTWVHNYLAERQDVCLPHGVKETFFFDRHWASGIQWYQSHFSHFDEAAHLQVIEVAPSYFCVEQAPERILNKLGAVKVAIMARDPVDRSWSHFLHLRRYGMVGDDLRAAVDRFPDIVEASRYSVYVPRWSKVFGAQRVNIFRFDDIVSVPAEFERQVEVFLGLPARGGLARLPARSNAAVTAPRIKWLARSGRWIASFLRKRRFYPAVNLAKRVRLDQLFYGGGEKNIPQMRSEDRAWLEEALSREYDSSALALDPWRYEFEG